jgi:hypothetical protein
MKRIQRLIICLILLNVCYFSFAQEGSPSGLIVQVDFDKNSFSSLSKNEQQYMNSSFSAFVRNITMVPEISVHTENTDALLRDIQKKSQINASVGLESENASYASDKGSKAKLLLSLGMKKDNENSYQLNCTISEIETRDTMIVQCDKISLNEIDEAGIDKLSYETLVRLGQKKYITPVSYDIQKQLLHEEDTTQNFQKYIDDYTKQAENTQKELDDLQNEKVTAEKKLETESEARVLRLKLEMIEKNKQEMADRLRKQQDEDAVKVKRDNEMKKWDEKQKDDFIQKIQDLNEKKDEIRKETIEGISLKKRIDLIESDKQNLTFLQSQLKQSIVESTAFYEKQRQVEIDEKNKEPWRKADLSNGLPTDTALNFRSKEIVNINSKYDKLVTDAEKNLNDTFQPELNHFNTQIKDSISDLQNKTYVFRSIDTTDDYLSLNVDVYDGKMKSWKVYSKFQMSDIQKIEISNIALPDTEITYKMMTGKEPVTEKDSVEADKEYQDLVDKADLYFRTSVPYLYSEIALHVMYNDEIDKYIVAIQYFEIHKTEDRSLLYRLTDADIKKEAGRIIQKERQETKKTKFRNNQIGRKGAFCGASYAKGPFYSGYDINGQFSIGSKYLFYGLEADFFKQNVFSQYYATYPDFMLLDVNAITGATINLGNIRPYIEIGAGFGCSLYGMNNSDKLYGVSALFSGGCDLRLKAFVIGAFYKLNYFYGGGCIDCYGASIGITY